MPTGIEIPRLDSQMGFQGTPGRMIGASCVRRQVCIEEKVCLVFESDVQLSLTPTLLRT
jgi:hypothetical protein